MEQGLFFDGIDTEPARTAIGGENNFIIVPGPDKTQTLLPFLQLALPGTQITLYSPVFQRVPIFRRMVFNRLIVHMKNIDEKGKLKFDCNQKNGDSEKQVT